MGRNLFFEKHFLPESEIFKPFLTFSPKSECQKTQVITKSINYVNMTQWGKSKKIFDCNLKPSR